MKYISFSAQFIAGLENHDSPQRSRSRKLKQVYFPHLMLFHSFKEARYG